MSEPKRSKREVAATLERLREEIANQSVKTDKVAPTKDEAPGKESSKRSKAAAGPRVEPPRRVVVTPPPVRTKPRQRPSDVEAKRNDRSEPPPVVPPRGASAGLSSTQLQVGDRTATSRVVQELLTHGKKGRGRVLGIAGLPRHGKTTLADRLRERAAERPGADLRYNKTERGDVNVYYIPGRRNHHALIDMAGEDYQVLGNYDRELPELLEAFLWPVLQRLDGLVLLMALPIVWSGWNDDDSDARNAPSAEEREQMNAARQRMLDSHRMLLKYAIVARNLGRLKRKLPRLNLSRDVPPTRDQIDDAFQCAPRYDGPVALALSKADLYVGAERTCLHTPNLPRLRHRAPLGLRPGASDPLLVAAGHFPEFLDFLRGHVRHFKWSFCQALEDRSEYPDPLEAQTANADVSSLIGGEGILDFLTAHPWSVPGLSSDHAIRIDQRLRREAWEAALMGGGCG